jgi:polyhydroxybutyrate depolymerase
MMALRLGCDISEKLAAVAPVIAGFPVNIVPVCAPARPLPLLLMNGTEDPMVPWNGGEVTVLGLRCGSVLSTEATIAFWVKRNGCSAKPEVTNLPDICPGDGSFVRVSTHSGSPSGADVVLYAVVGGGHTFPAGNHPDLKLLLGNKNRDILANEVIWDFFRRHSR